MDDILKYEVGRYTNTDKIKGIGFIPINLQLDIEGLSGIKMYQSYTIDDTLLPPSYKNKIQFIAKGVSHKIDSNGWTTTLESIVGPKQSGVTTNPPDKASWKEVEVTGNIVSANNSSNSNSNSYTPAPAPTGPVKDRILYVLEEMIKAGFSVEVAIGFVAGIRGESTNIDPTVLNKEGSGAYGIAQWLGDRKKKLRSLPGYDTLEVQVAFLIDELKTEGIGKEFTLNAKTTEEALAAIGPFERWSYPVKLYKSQPPKSKSYKTVYNILLAEVKAKSSPDGSFQARINYIQSVIDVAKEANLFP
jgi:hypothetical protein